MKTKAKDKKFEFFNDFNITILPNSNENFQFLISNYDENLLLELIEVLKEKGSNFEHSYQGFDGEFDTKKMLNSPIMFDNDNESNFDISNKSNFIFSPIVSNASLFDDSLANTPIKTKKPKKNRDDSIDLDGIRNFSLDESNVTTIASENKRLILMSDLSTICSINAIAEGGNSSDYTNNQFSLSSPLSVNHSPRDNTEESSVNISITGLSISTPIILDIKKKIRNIRNDSYKNECEKMGINKSSLCLEQFSGLFIRNEIENSNIKQIEMKQNSFKELEKPFLEKFPNVYIVSISPNTYSQVLRLSDFHSYEQFSSSSFEQVYGTVYSDVFNRNVIPDEKQHVNQLKNKDSIEIGTQANLCNNHDYHQNKYSFQAFEEVFLPNNLCSNLKFNLQFSNVESYEQVNSKYLIHVFGTLYSSNSKDENDLITKINGDKIQKSSCHHNALKIKENFEYSINPSMPQYSIQNLGQVPSESNHSFEQSSNLFHLDFSQIKLFEQFNLNHLTYTYDDIYSTIPKNENYHRLDFKVLEKSKQIIDSKGVSQTEHAINLLTSKEESNDISRSYNHIQTTNNSKLLVIQKNFEYLTNDYSNYSQLNFSGLESYEHIFSSNLTQVYGTIHSKQPEEERVQIPENVNQIKAILNFSNFQGSYHFYYDTIMKCSIQRFEGFYLENKPQNPIVNSMLSYNKYNTIDIEPNLNWGFIGPEVKTIRNQTTNQFSSHFENKTKHLSNYSLQKTQELFSIKELNNKLNIQLRSLKLINLFSFEQVQHSNLSYVFGPLLSHISLKNEDQIPEKDYKQTPKNNHFYYIKPNCIFQYENNFQTQSKQILKLVKTPFLTNEFHKALKLPSQQLSTVQSYMQIKLPQLTQVYGAVYSLPNTGSNDLLMIPNLESKKSIFHDIEFLYAFDLPKNDEEISLSNENNHSSKINSQSIQLCKNQFFHISNSFSLEKTSSNETPNQTSLQNRKDKYHFKEDSIVNQYSFHISDIFDIYNLSSNYSKKFSFIYGTVLNILNREEKKSIKLHRLTLSKPYSLTVLQKPSEDDNLLLKKERGLLSFYSTNFYVNAQVPTNQPTFLMNSNYQYTPGCFKVSITPDELTSYCNAFTQTLDKSNLGINSNESNSACLALMNTFSFQSLPNSLNNFNHQAKNEVTKIYSLNSNKNEYLISNFIIASNAPIIKQDIVEKKISSILLENQNHIQLDQKSLVDYELFDVTSFNNEINLKKRLGKNIQIEKINNSSLSFELANKSQKLPQNIHKTILGSGVIFELYNENKLYTSLVNCPNSLEKKDTSLSLKTFSQITLRDETEKFFEELGNIDESIFHNELLCKRIIIKQINEINSLKQELIQKTAENKSLDLKLNNVRQSARNSLIRHLENNRDNHFMNSMLLSKIKTLQQQSGFQTDELFDPYEKKVSKYCFSSNNIILSIKPNNKSHKQLTNTFKISKNSFILVTMRLAEIFSHSICSKESNASHNPYVENKSRHCKKLYASNPQSFSSSLYKFNGLNTSSPLMMFTKQINQFSIQPKKIPTSLAVEMNQVFENKIINPQLTFTFSHTRITKPKIFHGYQLEENITIANIQTKKSNSFRKQEIQRNIERFNLFAYYPSNNDKKAFSFGKSYFGQSFFVDNSIKEKISPKESLHSKLLIRRTQAISFISRPKNTRRK